MVIYFIKRKITKIMSFPFYKEKLLYLRIILTLWAKSSPNRKKILIYFKKQNNYSFAIEVFLYRKKSKII